MQKIIFWKIYHLILIVFMTYYFMKQEAYGICFNGFLLIYTQQCLLMEMQEKGKSDERKT